MFQKLTATCIVAGAVQASQLDPAKDVDVLHSEIQSLNQESTSANVKLGHNKASFDFLTQACAMEKHSSNWFYVPDPYHAKKWTSSCGLKGKLFHTPESLFTSAVRGGAVEVSKDFQNRLNKAKVALKKAQAAKPKKATSLKAKAASLKAKTSAANSLAHKAAKTVKGKGKAAAKAVSALNHKAKKAIKKDMKKAKKSAKKVKKAAKQAAKKQEKKAKKVAKKAAAKTAKKAAPAKAKKAAPAKKAVKKAAPAKKSAKKAAPKKAAATKKSVKK